MKGLVIGKFYPFHAGHAYLIESALERTLGMLHVIVVWKREEAPGIALRLQWIRERFPSPNVVLTALEDVYDDDDNSALWANVVQQHIGPVDVVFTSEAYGDPFARALGSEHVCVDLKREHFPVSGTKVRKDPEAYWAYLSDPVRHYYAQRYVFVGPESTGKSTIAAKVAEELGFPLVPEYGRTYAEGITEWTHADFERIMEGQLALERNAAAQGYRMICDTDTATTTVWAKFLLGQQNNVTLRPELTLRLDGSTTVLPALYLICSTKGCPFVQDGTRDHVRRQAMESEIIDMVKRSGVPYVHLSAATLDGRVEQAIRAIRPTRKYRLVRHIVVLLFGLMSILLSFFDLRSGQWWIPDGSWRSVVFMLSGIASFSGVLCVFLVAERKFSNFIWGIINCVTYGVFSISFGLIGNFQLNLLFFLPLQIVGMLQWRAHMADDSIVSPRSPMGWRHWGFVMCSAVVLAVGLYYEIEALSIALTGVYTLSFVGRILDASTTALSICAQGLLSYRCHEQWYFWIAVNLLQITMFSLPETLSVNMLIMWSIFLLNAVYGLVSWVRVSTAQ